MRLLTVNVGETIDDDTYYNTVYDDICSNTIDDDVLASYLVQLIIDQA